MIIPALIHFSFLAVYALLVGALLWHYRKYNLPHDPARWVIGPFLGFSVVFALIATSLLFYVPWDEIVSSLLFQVTTPSFGL